MCLMGGIWFAEYISAPIQVGAIIVSGLLITLFLTEITVRRKIIVPLLPLIVMLYLLLLALAGWFRAELTNHKLNKEKPEVNFLSAFENKELNWFGTVAEITISSAGTASIWMEVDSVIIEPGLPAFTHRFKTQVRFFRASDEIFTGVNPGTALALTATPQKIPDKRNPHDFDVRKWLNDQHVFIQAVGMDIIGVYSQPRWYEWGWWRYHLRSGIESVFRPEQAALAKAILIGFKAELDPEIRQGFSRAGLAHIMAVSGMHVGFVLLPLWILIPLFWGSRTGRFTGLCIISAVLFFYAGVTGFAPSVQRASVFAFFVAYARLYRKRRDPVNLTGVAAIIILLADPRSLFAIGFQMSFAAVLTIFVTLPVIRQLFSPANRYKWRYQTLQLVLLSVCIQLALFPILVDVFSEFSLVGPLLNTIAAPVTQVLFLWGFFCTGLGFIHDGAAFWLNYPANQLVAFLEWLTTYFSALPGSFITMSLPSAWVYGLWISLFGMLGTLFNPALRWKWLITAMLMTTGWQATSLLQNFHKPEAVITFFDVGQGDAVLIQTPGGKNILYDTGIINPFSNSADRVILPHLKAEGIRHLDAVFLSHPHSDHIGGIISLINNVSIGRIYDSGFEYHTSTYAQYREAASRKGIPVSVVAPGDTIRIDPAMPMFVLGPLPGLQSSNPNEYSVVLMAVFGNDRLLLTGDAETQAEYLLQKQYGDFLFADLLKAGHHGSRTSSHEYFLDYVRPKKVVVSNALRNRHQHPHPEATRRLQNTGAQIRFTSLQGAVIYTLTGDGIKHTHWRN